jgi:1-deoxy-D-xylulose-5-phosphate synthase
MGSFAPVALEIAALLETSGVGCTVIDPRWVIPVAETVVTLASEHRLVVTLEDGIRVGGIGTHIRQVLRRAGVDTGLDELGLPDEFLEHDTRGAILQRVGLTANDIAAKISGQLGGTAIPSAKPKRR